MSASLLVGVDILQEFSELLKDVICVDGAFLAPVKGFFCCEQLNFFALRCAFSGFVGVWRGSTALTVQEVLTVRILVQRFCERMEVTLVHYRSMLGNLFCTSRIVHLSADYLSHRT